MNIDLAKRTQASIMNIELPFDMRSWTMCIAYHAKLAATESELSNAEFQWRIDQPLGRHPNRVDGGVASNLLGLDDSTSYQLLHECHWWFLLPNPPEPTREGAVQMIQLLIDKEQNKANQEQNKEELCLVS